MIIHDSAVGLLRPINNYSLARLQQSDTYPTQLGETEPLHGKVVFEQQIVDWHLLLVLTRENHLPVPIQQVEGGND